VKSPKRELLPGTLDLLVLRVLSGGELHGWAITNRLAVLSEDVLQVDEGSLYPALYRMERKGWIEAEWGMSELGRKAKFYTLTARGRKQLKAESAEWAEFARAVSTVLAPSS
jgi:transcriptional regulator